VNANGYSLSNYGGTGAAACDVTYTLDLPDGSGIALFHTANAALFTTDNRLDAAGYTGVTSLYREGAEFPLGGNEIGGNIDYSFVRSMTRASGGLPKDTGDNAGDFIGVSTTGMATGQGQYLGAPGPENLTSPTNRNAQFGAALLDPSVSSSSPPNRVRDLTPDVPNNSAFGTMAIRRTFTNNTGEAVTRLRFRIVETTTFTSPAPAGQADLRARSSSDTTAMVNGNPVPVIVRGTTVEQPPTQNAGGGWNTSLNVPVVDGTILLAAPLDAGQSINVQFLLGVMQTGRFLFFLNIEATNGCGAPVTQPCGPAVKPALKLFFRKYQVSAPSAGSF